MSEPLIYIPTFRRPDRQTTWDNLSDEWRERTVMVCGAEDAVNMLDYPVLVCPFEEGAARKRQWIVNQHQGDKLVMVDDDIDSFHARRFDDPGKFHAIRDRQDTGVIFDRIFQMLDQIPFAGMVDRSGGNRAVPPVSNNGRIFEVQGVNVETFKAEGIDYEVAEIMDDFEVSLQFRERGYLTAQLATHCKGSVRGTPGGCSSYRTVQKQTDGAHSLAARHPGLVRITTRPGWGADESRTDVAISWAKALQRGRDARAAAGRAQEPEPDWSGLAPEWDLF